MRRLPLGSPPRMRGKDAGCLVHHKKHRITPAYAGKRDMQGISHLSIGDHPRVCGEKDGKDQKLTQLLGSPPRMRGKGECFSPYYQG